MKPLKFKVWNKEKKEMLPIQDYPNLSIEEKGRWFAMNGDEFYCNYMNGETLQFTGLYDANGQEIYEGDIIEYTEKKGWVAEIIYSAPRFHLRFHGDKTIDEVIGADSHLGKLFSFAFEWGHANLYKVIGNIYENPELCLN